MSGCNSLVRGAYVGTVEYVEQEAQALLNQAKYDAERRLIIDQTRRTAPTEPKPDDWAVNRSVRTRTIQGGETINE